MNNKEQKKLVKEFWKTIRNRAESYENRFFSDLNLSFEIHLIVSLLHKRYQFKLNQYTDAKKAIKISTLLKQLPSCNKKNKILSIIRLYLSQHSQFSISPSVVSFSKYFQGKSGLKFITSLMNNAYIKDSQRAEFFLLLNNEMSFNSQIYIYDQNMIFWDIILLFEGCQFIFLYEEKQNETDFTRVFLFIMKEIFHLVNFTAQNITEWLTITKKENKTLIFPPRLKAKIHSEKYLKNVLYIIKSSQEIILLSDISLLTKSSTKFFRERLIKQQVLKAIINPENNIKKTKYIDLQILLCDTQIKYSEITLYDRNIPQSLKLNISELDTDFRFNIASFINPIFGNIKNSQPLDFYCEFILQPNKGYYSNQEKANILSISPGHLNDYGYLDVQKLKKLEIKTLPIDSFFPAQEDDILLAIKGSVGHLSLVPNLENLSEEITLVPNNAIVIIRCKEGFLIPRKSLMKSIYAVLAYEEGKQQLKALGNSHRINSIRIKDLKKITIPLNDKLRFKQALSSFEINTYYKELIKKIKKRITKVNLFNRPEYTVLNKVAEKASELKFELVEEEYGFKERALFYGRMQEHIDVHYAFTHSNWPQGKEKMIIRLGIDPLSIENLYPSFAYWGLCLYNQKDQRINIDRKSNKYHIFLIDFFSKRISDRDEENDKNDCRFLCSGYIKNLKKSEFNFNSDIFASSLVNNSQKINKIVNYYIDQLMIIAEHVTEIFKLEKYHNYSKIND